MMQGTLRYQLKERSQCREISQRRISTMLKKVAPCAHRERAHDLLEKTNPIPYHAPYFGYKLHMDQNEKIAQDFGVTHVHALDGCSRMVLGFITMPRKNPVLIYQYLFCKFPFGIIQNAVTSWELLWAEVARRLDIMRNA